MQYYNDNLQRYIEHHKFPGQNQSSVDIRQREEYFRYVKIVAQPETKETYLYAVISATIVKQKFSESIIAVFDAISYGHSL
jgi:hypothetical protein